MCSPEQCVMGWGVCRELVHVIKKAKKSQDLQKASWKPRKADGPSSSSSPKAREEQCPS